MTDLEELLSRIEALEKRVKCLERTQRMPNDRIVNAMGRPFNTEQPLPGYLPFDPTACAGD